MLAGPLKSQDLLPCGLRNIDERELVLLKEIVLSALIDDPDETVFGSARIGHNWIDLAPNQGGLVAVVFQAQRELLG